MAQLRIYVLGAPKIEHGGQSLQFPTRKALALLIYLALEGGAQRRETLMTLFWPDSDDEQGRASLRNTLAYLNKALRAIDDIPHLEATRETITLLTDDLWIDAQQLDTAVSSEDLIACYRGEFLEGFSLSDAPEFDDWTSAERERLHDRLVFVSERLISEHYERGEFREALALARHWITQDRLNEAAYQWLIRLLISMGDRTSALQVYERFSALLDEELAISPSSETQALIARANDEVALTMRITRDSAASVKNTLPETPFVGRTAEFSDLSRVFHAVHSGQMQTVAIVGEAGIGKTRFAEQFLSWAQAEGALVLQSRAFESHNPLPYYPIVELLHAINTQTLPVKWRATLSKLLPELQEIREDEHFHEAAEPFSQHQLFEAVSQWLQTAAGKTPLVILIDDLQWLDNASRDLIQFAVRSWKRQSTRILLLLTMRLEDDYEKSEIALWLASLNREAALHRITLRALGKAEVVQLVQALGTVDPVRYGEWLFANAQGHPFYAAETLKDLFERGAITLMHGANGRVAVQFKQLPPTTAYIASAVRELVQTRLARLSTAAALLLTVSAVIGHEIPFELMQQVADFDETTALNALEELLERRLLIEAGGNLAYNFTHDKIREVAYEQISSPRRRSLHRRIFDALLETASPAILIYHALQAGIQNSEQISVLALQAGDTSWELFAMRDAIYYYELARQQRLELASDAHLTLKLARAYELNAEAAEARSLYEQLLAQSDLSVPLQITTLNRLATLLAQSFDTLHAIALLQKALVAAHKLNDRLLRAETQWGLAQITYYSGDFEPALIYAEGSLKWARELENLDLVARNLNLLAYIYTAKGEQQASIASADEAAALYARLGNRVMEMDSLGLKGNALLRYGETDHGVELIEYVLQASQQLENSWGQVSCLMQLTQGLLDHGEVITAIKNAEHAIQIATERQIPLLLPFAKMTLAVAVRAEARWEQSIQLLQEVLAVGISPEGAARVKAELCATYALAGRWEEAAIYALQLPDARIHPLILIERHIELETETLLRANHRKEAAQLIEQFSHTVGDGPRDQAHLERARRIYDDTEAKHSSL